MTGGAKPGYALSAPINPYVGIRLNNLRSCSTPTGADAEPLMRRALIISLRKPNNRLDSSE